MVIGLGFKMITMFVFLLLLISVAQGQIIKVFDVLEYGAVADGNTDNSGPFTKVWSEACKRRGMSSILVPAGTYRMGQISFIGPCNGPIRFLIKGVIKAPTSSSSLNTNHWITFRYVDQLTLAGGGVLDGQGSSAWKYNNCNVTSHCIQLPISLRFDFVKYSRMHHITLLNSKNFHMNIFASKMLQIRNIRIEAPKDSPNTDGIHIGQSSDIQISDSFIGVGDDCVSLGAGSVNIRISNVGCGPGHGISVGSLGGTPNEEDVTGIVVKNCTFIGTDNGLRIKTRAPSNPGNVYNLTVQDVIVNDVFNPILIEQHYCPLRNCDPEAASQVQIKDVKFSNIRGTSLSKVAVNLQCSSEKPCQNIELRNINITYNGNDGPAISSCSNVRGSSFGLQKPASCL